MFTPAPVTSTQKRQSTFFIAAWISLGLTIASPLPAFTALYAPGILYYWMIVNCLYCAVVLACNALTIMSRLSVNLKRFHITNILLLLSALLSVLLWLMISSTLS